jgi:hypothetical protein
MAVTSSVRVGVGGAVRVGAGVGVSVGVDVGIEVIVGALVTEAGDGTGVVGMGVGVIVTGTSVGAAGDTTGLGEGTGDVGTRVGELDGRGVATTTTLPVSPEHPVTTASITKVQKSAAESLRIIGTSRSAFRNTKRAYCATIDLIAPSSSAP